MSNGQKTKRDLKPVRLDIDSLIRRTNDRREKILDKIWIDNKAEIDKQIRDMPLGDIRDLMLLFNCSIVELAGMIKIYKEETKF